MPSVFVVDDEPVIACTLAAILVLQGYATSFFTSPLEALASARANVPDLLISNVAMPGISGIELAIEMKNRYPKCKILLLSGQDLFEEYRNHGHSFTLLTKPVQPSEMLSQIAALFGQGALTAPQWQRTSTPDRLILTK